MRRTLACLLLLIALLAAHRARAATTFQCVPPRCLDVAVPYPSNLKVPDDHVRILLPSNYDPSGPGYPVLYLLHGAGDTYRTWTENTDVAAFTKRFRLIVVMPDAGRNADAGWYSDWKDGSRDWESFHIRVLVPWIESHFDTLGAGHRAIAGLSMGGFGAMSYAARHRTMFAAAASFSGAVDTQYVSPVSGVAFAQLHDRYGTPDSRVWGDQTADSKTWAAHNPTALAQQLGCTRLWIASGNGTPDGAQGDDPSNPGGYMIEQFIWQMNQSFVRALDKAGVPHHDRFYTGGYHGWPYWQADLHWALPGLYRTIAPGLPIGFCVPPGRSTPRYVGYAFEPSSAGSTPKTAWYQMDARVSTDPSRGNGPS